MGVKSGPVVPLGIAKDDPLELGVHAAQIVNDALEHSDSVRGVCGGGDDNPWRNEQHKNTLSGVIPVPVP